MIERLIFYVLTGLTISIVFTYLTKATGKKVNANARGEYLLRMNKLYYILGIIAIVIAGIFVVVPPLVDTLDTALLIIIFFMLLFFGGLGVWCILYYKNHYLLFDTSRIEVRGPLGKTKSMQWEEIQQAKFSSLSGLLTLTSTSGEKLKIMGHLVGLIQFAHYLEERKGWTTKELKLPVNKG